MELVSACLRVRFVGVQLTHRKTCSLSVQFCEFWGTHAAIYLWPPLSYRTSSHPPSLSCSFVISALLSPDPAPGNHWYVFSHCIFFLFPECHVNGILQHAAFCVWLLSLSMTHRKPVRGCVSVGPSFLLLSAIPLPGDAAVCLSLRRWRTYELFPVWGWLYIKPLSTFSYRFLVAKGFHFSWLPTQEWGGWVLSKMNMWFHKKWLFIRKSQW